MATSRQKKVLLDRIYTDCKENGISKRPATYREYLDQVSNALPRRQIKKQFTSWKRIITAAERIHKDIYVEIKPEPTKTFPQEGLDALKALAKGMKDQEPVIKETYDE